MAYQLKLVSREKEARAAEEKRLMRERWARGDFSDPKVTASLVTLPPHTHTHTHTCVRVHTYKASTRFFFRTSSTIFFLLK